MVWAIPPSGRALPRGIEPVKGMTRRDQLNNTERVDVVGPYLVAYFWVDIEGFDTPRNQRAVDARGGLWSSTETMGPISGEWVSGLFQAHHASNQSPMGNVPFHRNGQDFVTAEIKSVPGSCEDRGGFVELYFDVASGRSNSSSPTFRLSATSARRTQCQPNHRGFG